MNDPVNSSEIAAQLVDDREVTEAGGDRFRHADLVAQLADLAAEAPTPSSIALFAPWGSGKSSIFNLLKEELDERNSSCRLVRYDAFRYAKLPLQRHFIQSLANALSVNATELGDGLYEGEQSNSIRFGSGESRLSKWGLVAQLLAFLVVLVAGATLLAVLVVTVLAGVTVWLSDTKAASDFGDVFFDLAEGNLVGFLAPAGLLALVAGVANRSLWVTRQRAAPTSEEEFGAAFEMLVEKAIDSRKHDRLLVFVDELDRCTAETVVETLDSLRTFLGAKNCVVVVAADQAALEDALTRRADVAVPEANPNPYYSSGSEYLDKTFHYQLQVPPLLPRRLSGFAASLVRGKPGVWSEVESVDHVVSVLIPNHVRSPRRAKTLLNSYAMSYNLAQRRAAASHISSNLSTRANELAFLTCLRVEFPLLAMQLREHPDLVGALRLLLGIGAGTRSYDPDTLATAASFLPDSAVAVGVEDPREDLADAAADPAGEESEEEATQPDEEEHDRRGSGGAERVPSLGPASARQLELYLRKTARVDIPRQDLVHLEGTGARFGIDAAIADSLDDAASQGDVDGVRQLLESLGRDRYRGIEALAASLERDASPLGEEAENLATVLLQIYGESADAIPSEESSRLTNHCAAAIDAHIQAYELRDEDLSGALALGLDSRSGVGSRLADIVLEDHRAKNRPDVAVVLLRRLSAGSGIALAPETVAPIVGAALAGRSEFDDVAESLAAADASVADEILRIAGPAISAGLEEATDTEDEEQQKAADARRRARCEAFLSAALNLDPARPDLAERAAWIVLGSDTRQARDAVTSRLEELVPNDVAQSWPLSRAMVRAASRRTAAAAAALLRPANPSHLDTSEWSALDAIAQKVWTHRDTAEDFESETSATVGELARLLPQPLSTDSETLAVISSAVGPVLDAATLATQQQVDGDLALLTEAGILDEPSAARCRAPHLITGLTTAIQPPVLSDGKVAAYYESALASTSEFIAVEEGLVESILASPWLLPPEKERLAIRAAGDQGAPRNEPPVAIEAVQQLLETHGADAAAVVTLWIRTFGTSAAASSTLLGKLLDTGLRLEGSTKDDVEAYAAGLESDELWELIIPELRAALERDLRVDFLTAARVQDVEPGRFADHLAWLITQASNNEQRDRALELWRLHEPPQGSKSELIERVLYPLIEENAGSFELVLRYKDLWTNPPRDVKQELRSRIETAARRLGKEDTANRRMADAGLKRRRRNILGQASYEDS